MSLRALLVLCAFSASALGIVIPNVAVAPAAAQVAFDFPVFTATRVYNTLVTTPPYIVTRTTTITWTCAEPEHDDSKADGAGEGVREEEEDGGTRPSRSVLVVVLPIALAAEGDTRLSDRVALLSTYSEAIEIAKAYSNARVVGVDITQNIVQNRLKNFRFVRKDITKTGWLPVPSGGAGYDVIHIRSVTGHLTEADADQVMQSVLDALKPGGILLLADNAGVSYTKSPAGDYSEIEPRFPGSTPTGDVESEKWFAGWSHAWMGVVNQDSTSIDELLRRNLARRRTDKNTKTRVLLKKRYYAPVGVPNGSVEKDEEELGETMLENTLRFIHATKPAILAAGQYTDTQLDDWIASIEHEFAAGERIYVGWDFIVVRG
ncbi:S-adenosyl-L-methionine-dependent methyltransferase [Mycena kentingensis (nom. inval.)]|nr:S-adenosyl-L-methionine-dependent methyltransferase [Mycena kentingensis (nom. inval.)]